MLDNWSVIRTFNKLPEHGQRRVLYIIYRLGIISAFIFLFWLVMK